MRWRKKKQPEKPNLPSPIGKVFKIKNYDGRHLSVVYVLDKHKDEVYHGYVCICLNLEQQILYTQDVWRPSEFYHGKSEEVSKKYFLDKIFTTDIRKIEDELR